MLLTNDAIKKIAKLARIRVEKEEYEAVAGQFAGIFGWIDQLQKVNTDGVPPYRDLLEQSTHERLDIVVENDQASAILFNAIEQAHGMFAVPKVIE